MRRLVLLAVPLVALMAACGDDDASDPAPAGSGTVSPIGCPEPDMTYTQALVPGTRIVLELEGTRSEYHSGGPRSILLCEHPEPPVGE